MNKEQRKFKRVVKKRKVGERADVRREVIKKLIKKKELRERQGRGIKDLEASAINLMSHKSKKNKPKKNDKNN